MPRRRRSAAPLPASPAIPGVIAAGQTWKVVWPWEGNNADGPIAGDDGTMLFANNDASNVMKMDPATGLATVLHGNTNTGGAVSRSKNGALFVAVARSGHGHRAAGAAAQDAGELLTTASRSIASAASSNDLIADARGGVYISGSGRRRVLRQPAGRRLAVRQGHPRPTASS